MSFLNFRRAQHHLHWILICFAAVSALGWYSNTFIPDSLLKICIFLLIIALILFSGFMFILNNVRRAIEIGFGVIILLILRYLGLREIYFSVLLVTIIILIDLFFSKKPTTTNNSI
jgi:hypothetical protein